MSFQEAAVFQHISSSRAIMERGETRKCLWVSSWTRDTQSDACQAYVQTTLKSEVATWVRLPENCRPKTDAFTKLKRPVVSLIKVLYGHPKSGAYWGSIVGED